MDGSTEGFVRGDASLAASERSRTPFFSTHAAVQGFGRWILGILGDGCADVRLGYAADPKAACN